MKKPQENNTKEFEFADDAISLNNETFEDDPPVINKALTENPYLNVNGKVELPTILGDRLEAKQPLLKPKNRTNTVDKDDTANSNTRTEHIQEVVNRIQEEKKLDRNENKLVLKKIYSYCTLPKNKKVLNNTIPKAVCRPTAPPKRITADGTHIYYWCDINKRGPSGKQHET